MGRRAGAGRSLMEEPPKPSFWRRTRLVLGDAAGHFNDDDGWAMSSHVALSALMAVFPFLIFVAALAGFIGRQALADRVADILFATWPEDVAGPISGEVHRVLTEPRGSLLTVSILVTLYLASNGVEAVRTALNRAYRVTENRNFVWRRAQSVFFVITGAFASLGLAFLGLLGPIIIGKLTGIVPALAELTRSFALSGFLVTGVVLLTVLLAAHLWLPAARPRALRLWPGIVLTLVLWTLAATIFGAYIDRFANYVSTYAGLAGVVAALFFLYLIAVIMIFGAEFNAAIARLRDGKLG
jgi:membrane protein